MLQKSFLKEGGKLTPPCQPIKTSVLKISWKPASNDGDDELSSGDMVKSPPGGRLAVWVSVR